MGGVGVARGVGFAGTAANKGIEFARADIAGKDAYRHAAVAAGESQHPRTHARADVVLRAGVDREK